MSGRDAGKTRATADSDVGNYFAGRAEKPAEVALKKRGMEGGWAGGGRKGFNNRPLPLSFYFPFALGGSLGGAVSRENRGPPYQMKRILSGLFSPILTAGTRRR